MRLIVIHNLLFVGSEMAGDLYTCYMPVQLCQKSSAHSFRNERIWMITVRGREKRV